jgi:ABC-type glycerol-3-phosphate transport system substrate-binding protein
MNNLNTFQIVLLACLGFIAFLAVLIFAGVIPGFRGPTGGVGGTVVLWGPIPDETMNSALKVFQAQYKSEFTLTYIYQDPRSLEANLVEALAAGRGPDLVIFPHTSLIKRLENISPLAYKSYPQLQFNNNFIRESKLYLADSGILALPLYLDPLVLYYNSDLLSAARLVEPPKTWKELEGAAKALTQVDQNNNLLASAIALGKANNIANAKDILSLLIMQAGNPITVLEGDKLNVVLTQSSDGGKNPAVDALDFFNRFSNSSNTLYSWSGAQPEARDAFLRGTVAMYLGYASEYNLIRRQNPQLNIEVGVVPQLTKNSAVTVGRLFGVSLMRESKNPVTAVRAMTLLSGATTDQSLATTLELAPTRKDLLRSFPKDPTQSVFYQSAIFSSGWLDPDLNESKKIFQKMIENSQSGATATTETIKRAQEELQLLSN